MTTNIGTGPQDIPLNQFLGEQAFLDKPAKVPVAIIQSSNDNDSGFQLSTIGSSIKSIIPTQVDYDNYGAYNTSTGEYTCPMDGVYEVKIGGNVLVSTLGSDPSVFVVRLYRNNVEYVRRYDQLTNTISWRYVNFTPLISCSAGDVLKIVANVQSGGGTANFDSDGRYTQMSFALVSH